MTQMPRASLCGRKAGRRMSRGHALSISDAPSTRPRPTRESEAPAPARVPATFCLELSRLALRPTVRLGLPGWALQTDALRSQSRETWISEVPLVYQKTCLSALRAFIFVLMLSRQRQL